MHITSPLITKVVLAATALASIRCMFSLFDDPEGPNLLIVSVGGAVVYFVALALFSLYRVFRNTQTRFSLSLPTSNKSMSVVIGMQLLIVSILYVCLR